MTDNFFKILLFGFFILLLGWLIVSPLIFIYWFFNTDMRDRFVERHAKISKAVFIGSFLSLMFILAQGIEQLLVFMPDHWGGYDGDGEFLATKSTIAFMAAFSLSFFFSYVFGKFEKMRKENRCLSMVADSQKQKEELRNSLIEKRDEAQTQLQSLRDQKYSLAAWEKDEIQVLESVLKKLEYWIQQTERTISTQRYEQES